MKRPPILIRLAMWWDKQGGFWQKTYASCWEPEGPLAPAHQCLFICRPLLTCLFSFVGPWTAMSLHLPTPADWSVFICRPLDIGVFSKGQDT